MTEVWEILSLSVLVAQLCPALCNTRVLCPSDSPGENTSHSLLQGIFLTQGLSLGPTLCRQILYHLSPPGNIVLYQIRYPKGLRIPVLPQPPSSLPPYLLHDYKISL